MCCCPVAGTPDTVRIMCCPVAGTPDTVRIMCCYPVAGTPDTVRIMKTAPNVISSRYGGCSIAVKRL
jgi:hypothetical protein